MDRTFSDEREFRTFAAQFAQRLTAGDVVGFSGPLGSGKTTFIKAIAQARLGSDPVSSPTFTFWHRYAAQGNRADGRDLVIDHLDL